ncbi:Nephrocystin-3 [Stylophora pistillata]|uniref:Nephrocystin-3 n=1 Tax=Stylophora pistillata TaxID=50429 RepID=A0A2B4RCD4_STYPI|nr:Nephrocystin-3 [Stylophora pistillata]
MERSRSEEDMSSSDEPDPKRQKRDNLGSTTRKRESNLKNVLVLTSHDVRKKDGKVYMPNTIEMAQLKKPERGQFKTKIKFPKTMTGKDVEEELRRQFLVLKKDGRFYCGTLVENRTRMEFHDNPPTVWDGTKINRRIRGNSALYVYFEETPELVFERPEAQTVDSLKQQLQTPMHEQMGSPPSYYSEKLRGLKRQHDPSSSLVPEVVSSTGASVKEPVREGTCHEGSKEGEQQSPQAQLGYHGDNSTAGLLCNSGTFQKTQNQQIGLKQSTGEDHSKEPQVITEDSAYETAAGDASDVDDKTKHSKGKIEEARSGVVARIEDYLQNSKVGTSEESSLEEIDSIRISPHDQGGTEFVICLNVKGIPENVTSLRARFDGVGFADLTQVATGVYTGNSPASVTLGKVAVTVSSLDDTWNSPDETEFEYHPNVTQELQKLISKMPDTKRNIPLDDQTLNPSRSAGTVCSSSSFSFYAGDISSLADENQDKSSLKALRWIVFAAAATNDRKCVETIFRTSAGEAVFQTYRNSSILPEDTARARGHQNLAEYLQNVHKRLSNEIDCNVQTVTIDWVELKRATAEKNICSGADEFQPVGDLEPVSFLESDDDESSYFADDETSDCQSPSTSEFSNEDQYVESKCTDDAEVLKHFRSDDDHGDQFDELKLSSHISALDKVFDSANQVITAKGSKCKSMATSWEYTEEQLNYYRICYIVTDVLTEGLRTIFKQEWDNRYKATLGEWKDEPKNGMDFESHESPRNRRRNAHLLKTMIDGDRAEWDCTMLFYAILYSDCICSLHPAVQSNVDDLRKFRNEDFAHRPRGFLSSRDFQDDILKDNLGLLHSQLGKLSRAKEYHKRALAIFLKKRGAEHVDVATSCDNLGFVCRQLGDLKQAKDCHERALDIRRKQLSPEHLNFATSYDNLGLLHQQLVDLKQAKDCHKRALDIRLKQLGPQHVDVLTSYDNLGLVQSELSGLRQAKDGHERALDIRLKQLGP